MVPKQIYNFSNSVLFMNIKEHKKSVSIMIAQVLLVVFVLSVSTLTYVFYKEYVVDITKKASEELEDDRCDYFGRDKTSVSIEKIKIITPKEKTLNSFYDGSVEVNFTYENYTSSPQVTYIKMPKEVFVLNAEMDVIGYEYP